MHLPHKDISTLHASFIVSRSSNLARPFIHLLDSSTNGTFVNDERLEKQKEHLLKNGDTIRFADTHGFIFRYSQEMEKSIFDLYVLGDVLGSGHYATVKDAVSRRNGSCVAVKIFHPHRSSGDTQFNQELEVLMSVSHEHIVKFYEAFVEPVQGSASVSTFLVLEKVTGEELFNRVVRKGKLRQDETKEIFRQLLKGIEYLHEKGIAHRDIKPENILLAITPSTSSQPNNKPWDENEADVKVKIADFGLAKFIGELKFTHTLCGTPAYVAPEVLINSSQRKYNKSVDLWSVGVLLYVCLCGFPPFSEELAPPSMKNQILGGRYAFFSPYWDDIDDTVLDLISRLLIVDPRERMNITECLSHRWFTGIESPKKMNSFQDLQADSMSVRIPQNKSSEDI